MRCIIVVVGHLGTGKSTIAKMLADALGVVAFVEEPAEYAYQKDLELNISA